MAALLIVYDLHRPGQPYAELHEAIKNLGSAWWHYLESTWIVDTFITPQAAWEKVGIHVDQNDRLLIVEITHAARQGWLPPDAWSWLSEHAG